MAEKSVRYVASKLDFGTFLDSASLPRCEHGTYLARADERGTGRAWYCVQCRREKWGLEYTYGLLGGDQRILLGPKRYIGSPRALRVAEHRTANLHEFKSRNCPRCQGGFHYEERDGEGNRFWTCADCGHRWERPRRMRGCPQSGFIGVPA